VENKFNAFHYCSLHEVGNIQVNYHLMVLYKYYRVLRQFYPKTLVTTCCYG